MSNVLSIIVPVYNVQDYIDETIKSILNQTISDFELILVNDGSQDQSGQICKEYASKDSRIKYVEQKNSGVTIARATGVFLSSCKYIMFCDGDDILPQNAIESLLSVLEKFDCDIVIGRIYRFKNENPITINDMERDKKEKIIKMDNVSFISKLLNRSIPSASSTPAHLYRRDLFNENIFKIPRDIVRGEDFIMNLRYAIEAHNICYTNKIVYYYRQHSASTMHTFRTSWRYEKNFLDQLFYPILQERKFDKIHDDLLRCSIVSLASAYYDTELNYHDSDFQLLKKEALKIHLSLLDHIVLLLIYFPPKIRYFLYRVFRKILYRPNFKV